jgi:RNA polymerase sigma factor (sigma-70 family)
VKFPFGAYATIGIKRWLIRFIEKWRNQNRPLRHFPAALELTDPNSESSDSSDYAENVEMVHRVRREMPPRCFDVLTRYYVQGETLDQIGQVIGMSRQRAGQINDKALQRARKALRHELSEGGCSA